MSEFFTFLCYSQVTKMEDPDDDWDVEAELQRQLDALDTPTEEKQMPPFSAPEEPLPGANAAAIGFSARSALSDGTSELQLVDWQSSKDGVQESKSLFSKLEALLKERESKLDAFHLTLTEVLNERAPPPEEGSQEQSGPQAAPPSQLPDNSNPTAFYSPSTNSVKAEPQSPAKHPKLAVLPSEDSLLLPPPTHNIDREPEVALTSYAEDGSQHAFSNDPNGAQRPTSSKGVDNAEIRLPPQNGPSTGALLPQTLLVQRSPVSEGSSRLPDAQRIFQPSLDLPDAGGASAGMQSDRNNGAKRGAWQTVELERREMQKDGGAQDGGLVAPARDLRSEVRLCSLQRAWQFCRSKATARPGANV